MTDKECFNIVLTINQCNSFVLENNHLTKPTIQSLSKLQLTCRSGSKKHTSFKNTTQELLKGVDKRAFCSDFWVEIMRNTTILTLDLTLVTSFTTILCSWQRREAVEWELNMKMEHLALVEWVLLWKRLGDGYPITQSQLWVSLSAAAACFYCHASRVMLLLQKNKILSRQATPEKGRQIGANCSSLCA